MKTLFHSLCAAAAVLVASLSPAVAQEPVSTGNIIGMQPAEGTVTIRSDQTSRPITFYGADKANIFTADGAPFLLQNIGMGTKVTIQYATRGERWYISKMILPAGTTPPQQQPAPKSTTGGGAANSTNNPPTPPAISNSVGAAGPTSAVVQPPGNGATVNVEPPTTSAGRDMRDGDITTQANPKQPRTLPPRINR